jgi:DNA repair photolyase
MTRHIQYEALPIKNILNKVTAPSMPFEWSINPYRGCQHGCSFCYARATHSFLGVEADDTFQNHIFVKSDAAAILDEQLHKIVRSKKGQQGVGRIAIGTATDPYQPVEANSLLTRACLEVIAKYQVPTSITTRSPLVLRDMDLLKKIPITSINLSVNTLNLKVWRDMEPSTPSPIKRLETVKHLTDEGIPAGIFLAPILPYLTDSKDDLAQVMETAAHYKAQFVMSSFLRLTTFEVKVWFFENLRRYYPHLVERYGELYQNGGYLPEYYLAPLKKTIRSLLLHNHLQDIEPFRGKSKLNEQSSPNKMEPDEQGPLQLSFSF